MATWIKCTNTKHEVVLHLRRYRICRFYIGQQKPICGILYTCSCDQNSLAFRNASLAIMKLCARRSR